jgi:hypothetical protein
MPKNYRGGKVTEHNAVVLTVGAASAVTAGEWKGDAEVLGWDFKKPTDRSCAVILDLWYGLKTKNEAYWRKPREHPWFERFTKLQRVYQYRYSIRQRKYLLLLSGIKLSAEMQDRPYVKREPLIGLPQDQ